MIGGRADDKRGKSQTVGDRKTLPLCRKHHEDFHHLRGVFRGWTAEGRRIWQEEEILRLNAAFAELELHTEAA